MIQAVKSNETSNDHIKLLAIKLLNRVYVRVEVSLSTIQYMSLRSL